MCIRDRYVNEVRAQLASDAVLLVDPAAGLVDPAIIDALIEHSRQREAIEICFTQAAPGLGGVLLRPKLLDQLAADWVAHDASLQARLRSPDQSHHPRRRQPQ